MPLWSRLPPKMSPDNTRCAASATASAISEPSRATELPALLAVSAASEPASRIFLRTLGEALIAAAAAFSARETYNVRIDDLGTKDATPVPREEYLAMRSAGKQPA